MDDTPRKHWRWGMVVGLTGIAMVAVGIWLGASVGWDVGPSSARINHRLAAARGSIAIVSLGAITAFVGAVVALAPHDRR